MKIFIGAGIAAAVTMIAASSAVAGGGEDYSPSPVWSGLYIGVIAGGAWGDGDHKIIEDGVGFLNGPFGPADIEGKFLGGQIGYDWQAGNLVIGVVGEYSTADIDGVFDNGIAQGLGPGDDDIYNTAVSSFGSIRAKAGVVVPNTPNVLVYGFAGLAFAKIEASNGDGSDVASVLDCDHNCAFGDETETGYTVGGGLAWMIPLKLGRTSIVVSAEYAYYDFDDVRIKTVDESFGNNHEFDVDANFHTVRGGLGLKF